MKFLGTLHMHYTYPPPLYSLSVFRITLTQAGGVRSDQFFGGHYTEIPADAQGRFDIVGLRPGSYQLAAGGAPFMNIGTGTRYGRVVHDPIRVAQDEWKQDVNLRLPGELEERR